MNTSEVYKIIIIFTSALKTIYFIFKHLKIKTTIKTKFPINNLIPRDIFRPKFKFPRNAYLGNKHPKSPLTNTFQKFANAFDFQTHLYTSSSAQPTAKLVTFALHQNTFSTTTANGIGLIKSLTIPANNT